MTFFFITLSLADELPNSSLLVQLQKYAKYLYVNEYGKKGDNHHIHAIIKIEENPPRTDKITEKFRSLYNPEFLKTLENKSNLVRTKVAKNWKRLYGEYLLKEKANKDFKSLVFEGFSEYELKTIYKQSNIRSLIQDKTMLSLSNAPFHMVQYLKDQRLMWSHKQMNGYVLLSMMASEGYITHHLMDTTNLQKIECGVNALLLPQEKLDNLKNKYREAITPELLSAHTI